MRLWFLFAKLIDKYNFHEKSKLWLNGLDEDAVDCSGIRRPIQRLACSYRQICWPSTPVPARLQSQDNDLDFPSYFVWPAFRGTLAGREVPPWDTFNGPTSTVPLVGWQGRIMVIAIRLLGSLLWLFLIRDYLPSIWTAYKLIPM